MIFGVAEDHDSNPIKMGLSRLKARKAKIIAVNPVRTGYNAIADEWGLALHHLEQTGYLSWFLSMN